MKILVFLALVTRIERLEAELEISKKTIEKISSVGYTHPVEKKRSSTSSDIKFSENDNLYDDGPQVYKSLFKSK